MIHCCSTMKDAVESACEHHKDRWDCPDALVSYCAKFDEYGIIIHDGGSAVSLITFCPWCGAKLPESKRDRWFDELERLGFQTPGEEEIPEIYNDARWYSR
ncbi:MAG: hypothetical protein IPL39_01045 [Opitutaceae bacterium]|nr:hypothetical protein [Opitutaceae bacterium]